MIAYDFSRFVSLIRGAAFRYSTPNQYEHPTLGTEELVGEGYVVLMKIIDKHEKAPQDEIEKILYRSMKNRVIDLARKESRTVPQVPEECVSEIPMWDAYRTSPEAIYGARESLDRLLEVAEDCSLRHLLVLETVLEAVEDSDIYDVEEVAEDLDLSTRQVSRVLSDLRFEYEAISGV